MGDNITIGFIGQGFIGKNYADDFEARGYRVVRYGLELEHAVNKDNIPSCDVVFIAVPTPTTPDGFDASIVREALGLVGAGKTAVVKSTTAPGTIKKLQAEFPDKTVLHSPEFLTERNAAYDAAHPTRNIIGIPAQTPQLREKAEQVLALLPKSPYETVIDSTESELIKYAANAFLYMKVVFANLCYDLSVALGANWEAVRAGVAADPRIGPSHMRAVDASGHTDKTGRGAGGHCFIKDFAALARAYEAMLPSDAAGVELLQAFEKKNNELLRASDKDLDLLAQVYGPDTLK